MSILLKYDNSIDFSSIGWRLKTAAKSGWYNPFINSTMPFSSLSTINSNSVDTLSRTWFMNNSSGISASETDEFTAIWVPVVNSSTSPVTSPSKSKYSTAIAFLDENFPLPIIPSPA